MFSKQTLLLLCLGLITACGGSGPRQASSNSPIIRIDGGTPIYLQQEDRACDEASAANQLARDTTVTFYQDQKDLTVGVDLSRLSGLGLQSEVIEDALVGANHLYKRNFRDARPIVSGGRSLAFCRSQGGYRRFSLENAALAAAYGILQAFDAYERIRHHVGAPHLPALTLLVQPETVEESHLEDSITRKTLTDNAAWFKDPASEAFYISVMAHSRERDPSFPGKFWEQPSILSHEYAHHVFYHLLTIHLQHPVEEPPLLLEENPANAQRPVTRRLLHGIEEGFADLYAYLAYQSLGASPFHGRMKFHLGRDVESNFLLAHGRTRAAVLKTLDSSYLWLYFTTNPLSYMHDASELLRDEHTIGAIIAYGLNQFYSQASDMGFLSPKQQGSRKLLLLLKWVQAMALRAEEIKAWDDERAPQLLEDLLYLAIASAQFPSTASAIPLTPGQCKSLQGVFPLFFVEWQEAGKLPGCQGLVAN